MRNDLPSDSASNFSARVRETLMTYLGKQGDPLDRGITLRDLIDSGFATWAGGKIGGGSIPLKPGQVITDSAAAPDLTPPPTPTNFIATAGITTFLAQHDTPTYTQGGGHLRTRLYGKIRNAGDPAPVFADATEIAQFTGAIYAHSTNPATTWHLWAKWETKAGVLSASPAGGTNGVVVTTGQDVSKLLDALTGKITAGQLYSDLGSRIDLIDGPSTLAGSVAARIASEASARTTAINTAVGNLQDQIDAFVAASGGDVGALLAAINTEQGSRIQGDTALANQNTLLLAISGANTAAIGVESLTRASSDSALSQTVTTLVARTGTNTAAILNESEVRSQADAASAYQIAGLKTSVDESVAGLTVEREVRATSDSAISTQLTALSASVGDSRGAILAEQNVRAAADQVQVSATSGLSAIVAATSAALTTEAFARATADTATVQTTTSLLATVGSANASIGQEQAVRISAQSALASQLTTLGSSMGASIAALKEETDARTTQDTATTSQITTLQASVGTNTAAIQTEATVRASETGSLFAKYGVKVDLAGHVSGYGLMSTANNSVPESEFGVRADSFFVAPPSVSSSTAPSSNLYSGYAWVDTSVVPNVTKYWNGSTWVTTPPRLPFIVQTTATTINGVSVPAGVYIDTAFIRDGTITNAKIGDAAIDNAKIANLDAAKITTGFLSADRIQTGTLDAKIASIDAAVIGTGTINVARIGDASINSAKIADTLQSNNFVAGSAGWQINKSGSAFFNDLTMRGVLNGGAFTGYAWPANNGTGVHLGPNGLLAGNFNTGKWVEINANGNLSAPGFNITNGVATFSGVVAGNVTVTSGQVTGLLIKTLMVPASYSGIRYTISNGNVGIAPSSPWSVNGNPRRLFLLWYGTFPAPETVAHKIAFSFYVTATNNRGSSAGDLDVRAYVFNSVDWGTQTASGEEIGVANNASPFSQSVGISGGTANTYSTEKTVAVFVTGYQSDNTVGNYGGLFWGAR